jgi:hypothetical protein
MDTLYLLTDHLPGNQRTMFPVWNTTQVVLLS